MHNFQILIIIAVIAFLAIRLYKKYGKKNKNDQGINTNPSSGKSVPSSSKDEDYEPYSKK
jgi:hypothetical protein